jgi:glycyl-tRNA synthetase beta chain
LAAIFDAAKTAYEKQGIVRPAADTAETLLAFFADRLKVHLREKGVRHDLVAAVFAAGGEDDLLRLLARVEALAAFLASEDGANLLTAYKRASNIVRIEEAKDKASYDGAIAEGLLAEDAEKALSAGLARAGSEIGTALGCQDFAAAMAALARLRPPVDAFFEKVTVNCGDKALRANRLKLLAGIRSALGGVADFSKIEG